MDSLEFILKILFFCLYVAVQVIIQDVVFPLLCHSAEDEQLWNSDPVEYIRTKYGEFMLPLLLNLLYWFLTISWLSRVTHEEVRARTRQCSMDDKLSERRLRWLGHVIQMDHQHIPRQALHREVPGFKRGPGRPWTNWRSTVNKESPGRKQRWRLDDMYVMIWY